MTMNGETMNLWHTPTRLNLDAVDRSRFAVLEDPETGHRLVTPLKRPTDGDGMMTDFRDGEDWLRSLETDADGEVVSVGFPKFYNHGEKPERDAVAARWRAEGCPAYVREKFDGTLVIATFRGGRRHYRTRGQFNMGSFQDALAEALPTLEPVGGAPGVSYLLELLGPVSRQVVDYGDRHTLRYLACVRHGIGLDRDCGALAIGVQWSRTLEGPGAVAAFAAEVAASGREVGEGFVVDTVHPSGDRLLVKVKSDWYRQAHSILSGATRPKVWRLLATAGAATEAEAVAALEAAGFDFEVVTSAAGWVREYVSRRADVLAVVCSLLREAPAGVDQKTLALWAKGRAGESFPVVMSMAKGDTERAGVYVLATVLDEKAGTLKGVSLGAAGCDALAAAWASRSA
jgi:hypothetical protein